MQQNSVGLGKKVFVLLEYFNNSTILIIYYSVCNDKNSQIYL